MTCHTALMLKISMCEEDLLWLVKLLRYIYISVMKLCVMCFDCDVSLFAGRCDEDMLRMSTLLGSM